MNHMPRAPQPQSQREFAQSEVAGFLRQSKAFNEMPPDKQAQVMEDTKKVVGFIADAGGEDMLKYAVGAKPMARHRRGGFGRALNTPEGEKSDSDYMGDALDEMAEGVAAIDFPGFVADLVKGVFQAVVDASIQQMEAFAELVANVSKSVDQFMKDNVSEDQARDYLAGQYPDHIQADIGAGKLMPRPDADEDNAPNFLEDLGLPFDLGDLGDEEAEKELVTAGRKKMAMDRQQMLATMVLMGLNRIIVTDGQIRASVVFDLNVKAMQEERDERNRSFEYNRQTDYTRRNKSGKGGFLGIGRTSTTKSKLNVKTDTRYASDATSEEERTRETELKAKLTGNVDLRFKSETFPLEKMVDFMGFNQETIVQAAAPPAEAAPAAPGVAPPPPPPLPT